jgi:hypothetical protein
MKAAIIAPVLLTLGTQVHCAVNFGTYDHPGFQDHKKNVAWLQNENPCNYRVINNNGDNPCGIKFTLSNGYTYYVSSCWRVPRSISDTAVLTRSATDGRLRDQ